MSGVGRDMSVFVTGAESFVGRALVDVCDLAGIPVEGVDLADCTSSRWGHLDIRDPALADAICNGLNLGAAEKKAQLAAWTVLVNALYNLDITKTRE